MPSYIDIAVNLVGSSLEKDLDTVIANAAEKNVASLIVIGSDIDESEKALSVCQQHPRQLFCTAGVHPHQASSWDNDSRNDLIALHSHPEVVAMGECGLDYNRDFSPRAKQREVFETQLDLAAELKKPVLMHERDASEDFLAILKTYRDSIPGALIHCFTGNRTALDAYLDLDLHIGITGWVCDERRGTELASLVPLIPNDRIMIETDSPYLLPRSMRPKPKSNKNKPEYLPYIAQEIAGLRHQALDDFAKHAYRNSLTFFGLTDKL